MRKRVAISVESMEGLESQVDQKFGRAKAFIIVDSDSLEVLAQFFNYAASAAQGAGTVAAVALNNNDVDAVISGRFGPKAFQSLEAFNIEMWTASGKITVREALEQLATGKLERMEVKVY